MRPQTITGELTTYRERYGTILSVSKKTAFYFGKYCPRIAPMHYVLGHPRSGTTWITSLVADSIGLPFVEASLLPVVGPSVYHGHEIPKGLNRPTVYVVRDGRDVYVSWYFYRAKKGDQLLKKVTGLPKSKWTDRGVIRKYLPQFIKTMSDKAAATGGDWGTHVRSGLDCRDNDNLEVIKYEDVLRSPVDSLMQTLKSLYGDTVNEERVRLAVKLHSFERVTEGRERGSEDKKSFHRKGVAGDWVNYFTEEALEVFAQKNGEVMGRAGYEL